MFKQKLKGNVVALGLSLALALTTLMGAGPLKTALVAKAEETNMDAGNYTVTGDSIGWILDKDVLRAWLDGQGNPGSLYVTPKEGKKVFTWNAGDTYFINTDKSGDIVEDKGNWVIKSGSTYEFNKINNQVTFTLDTYDFTDYSGTAWPVKDIIVAFDNIDGVVSGAAINSVRIVQRVKVTKIGIKDDIEQFNADFTSDKSDKITIDIKADMFDEWTFATYLDKATVLKDFEIEFEGGDNPAGVTTSVSEDGISIVVDKNTCAADEYKFIIKSKSGYACDSKQYTLKVKKYFLVFDETPYDQRRYPGKYVEFSTNPTLMCYKDEAVNPDNYKIEYQWYEIYGKYNIPLEGATEKSFNFYASKKDDGTKYYCQVTATCGDQTITDNSREALLTVWDPINSHSGYTPPVGGGSGTNSSKSDDTKDEETSVPTLPEDTAKPYVPTKVPVSEYSHPNAGKSADVYRLYNPVSGEHILTSDANEASTLVSQFGWIQEAVCGRSSSANDKPVYRLLNPVTGEHLYTMDQNEVRVLSTKHGWTKEGVVFFVGGNTPMYRLFNPNVDPAVSHHLTVDENEYRALIAQGWEDEGVAWNLQ